jgi:glycosyltransferase involved in cell wall biosynthesis
MIEYFFWILLFLIGYSYFIYPSILFFLVKRRSLPNVQANFQPFVSIIIPVYNEELFIQRKIESIFDTNYPLSKIELIIYSDGSTDQTKNIVTDLSNKYPQIIFLEHQERKGKSSTVNRLVKATSHDIIITTDANIIFDRNTIGENVKNYMNEDIGLVASLVNNQILNTGDLTLQEKRYVSWENSIKYNEGVIWGTTISPFGACFSFRKRLYVNIPENFLVDDFFIATYVLKQNKKCILEKKSICYEELTGSLKSEIKRRIRISTGNFQNLVYFFKTFTQLFSPIGFCFWSHKGIRWLTPFFLITILILNIFLFKLHIFYQFLLLLQLLYYCTTLTLYIFDKSKSVNNLVKFAHYFIMMNAALLIGFVHFLCGVKVGYWDITERKV